MVPMPVMMRIIIPDSGSRRKPHGTWNDPTAPDEVWSGMDGIHCATTTSNARASGASASSCQNATSDTPRASAIIAHATRPAVRREK